MTDQTHTDPPPTLCEAKTHGRRCGRGAVVIEGPTQRPLCRAHAPWYPEKLGHNPKLKDPCRICCVGELVPVSSMSDGEAMIRWKRCNRCGISWDLYQPSALDDYAQRPKEDNGGL